jgi:LuxR family quorum-sensing system transcriptional regulator SinR
MELIRLRFELSSVIYLCPSFSDNSLADPYIVQTPLPGWGDEDKAKHHALSQSMLQLMARTVLPMDWEHLRREKMDASARRILAEYTIANRHGFSIPVRGPSNGVWALLIATSNEGDSEWASRRLNLMKDLVLVAHFVHQRACQMHGEGAEVNLNSITAREKEALQWASQGQGLQEISLLMRIRMRL